MTVDEPSGFGLVLSGTSGANALTERQWLAEADPTRLLPALASQANVRRLRLFLCGCFRRRRELKTDEPSTHLYRTAVELAEQWADGLVGQAEVFSSGVVGPVTLPLFANDGELRHRAAEARNTRRDPPYSDTAPERAARAALVRDIFGNPFRPVAFDREWRTSTAVALGRQMYEAREFGAMPILADALQDAGCEGAAVLDHCRGPGPHVRGCWVVDLVLGKT